MKMIFIPFFLFAGSIFAAKLKSNVQVTEKVEIKQQTLWLSPEKCIYWEQQNSLIVSDLHFGKTGHFRKSGIPIPQNLYKEDLQRLLSQIQHFKPSRLIIVGDLFHSAMNKELDLFLKWRNDFESLQIDLIKGNHDILKKEWYELANISVSGNHLSVANFCFVHDINEACEADGEIDYYFSGHIHPCIAVKGLGRQELKFPCYFFRKDYAILPAFGKFTGTALMKKNSQDLVYVIIPTNNSKGELGTVMKLN